VIKHHLHRARLEHVAGAVRLRLLRARVVGEQIKREQQRDDIGRLQRPCGLSRGTALHTLQLGDGVVDDI
jgi:hypothetical protein